MSHNIKINVGEYWVFQLPGDIEFTRRAQVTYLSEVSVGLGSVMFPAWKVKFIEKSLDFPKSKMI